MGYGPPIGSYLTTDKRTDRKCSSMQYVYCTSVRPKTDPGAGSDFVVSVFYGSDPMMPNTETPIKSAQVGVVITRFLWVGLRYAADRTPCHKL